MPPFFMPRNKLERDEMKFRVEKLLNELEYDNHSEGIKFLASKYLYKVLDIIDEYRY